MSNDGEILGRIFGTYFAFSRDTIDVTLRASYITASGLLSKKEANKTVFANVVLHAHTYLSNFTLPKRIRAVRCEVIFTPKFRVTVRRYAILYVRHVSTIETES